MLQALGGGGIAAVRDMEPAVGIAVLLEFQHDAFQRTMLTTGLAENIQLPGLTCLTDDPDAQHPRHSSNGRLHAAIAGQIGQRFQREEQMGVLVVAEHLFTDLVKLLPLSQQIPQMLGQQALLRAGGKAVQHEHPLAGVLLLVFLGGQLGGIVAAGQSARDGDGIHLVGSLVGGQPVADVGAGGRGLALIGTQGLGHAHGIHRAVVQIFGIVGDDLQGDAFKIHALQGVQAGGGIHNNLGVHKHLSPFRRQRMPQFFLLF